MKEILTIILFALLFITIVLAILFHERVRNIKKMVQKAAEEREARKQAKEDEYFKRTSTKNYRKDEEAPKFDKDYFKSKEEAPTDQPKQESQKKATTRRTTTTDSGVTIIDDRGDHKTDRKIFNDNEGEYVEFEEV